MVHRLEMPAYDPSWDTYRVRKPFTFAAVNYGRGDLFKPFDVNAPNRKTRMLFEQRYLERVETPPESQPQKTERTVTPAANNLLQENGLTADAVTETEKPDVVTKLDVQRYLKNLTED